MAFAAYLLENAMFLLARGGAFVHIFLWSTVVFLDEPPGPTVGICSFSKNKQTNKKTDKCPREGGGRGRGDGHAWNCLIHH